MQLKVEKYRNRLKGVNLEYYTLLLHENSATKGWDWVHFDYRPKMYIIPRFYNNNGNKTSLQILGMQ